LFTRREFQSNTNNQMATILFMTRLEAMREVFLRIEREERAVAVIKERLAEELMYARWDDVHRERLPPVIT